MVPARHEDAVISENSTNPAGRTCAAENEKACARPRGCRGGRNRKTHPIKPAPAGRGLRGVDWLDATALAQHHENQAGRPLAKVRS